MVAEMHAPTSAADVSGIQVMLTFDVDGPSAWIQGGHTSPTDLSRGEFTVVGTRRVLRLLQDQQVSGTFFITGHTAATYPWLVRDVLEDGHEVAHHGWLHESPATLSVGEEELSLNKGTEALMAAGAPRPSGYRSPGWSVSPDTTRILADHGFRYDSSMMGDDHSLYWCRTRDETPADLGMKFGPAVDVVEVPVAWHLDDAALFEFYSKPGHALPGLATPSSAIEIWTGDLDYLREQERSSVFTLTMHPEVIGRGHRLRALEVTIGHAKTCGAVFDTCSAVTEAWRKGPHS